MNRTATASRSNVLDTDRIGRLLVTLSIPAFFGMFVQTLYNVINTVFVGQYVGPLAIAGLSIVFPLQMLGTGMGQMVGIGGTSLISRYIGAHRHQDAEKALGNGLSVGVIVAGLVMLLVLPLMDFWLRLIGASDAVLPFARDYLTIIMYSLPFQILSLALLNYSRAEGNARIGMAAMIAAAAVNLGLDFVFIAWLDYGVKGAAWATFLSQVTSLVIFGWYYLGRRSFLKFQFPNLRPNLAILRPMFAIGIGAFMQTVSGSLSGMILINAAVVHGGDYGVSAMGITQRLFMFAVMPSIVLAQGGQPIVGFNYGARRFNLVIKAITLTFLSSTILGTAAFLFLYFSPAPLIRIFTDDVQLIDLSIDAARFMLLGLPLLGFINCGLMVFQAIGKAVPAFVVAVGRQLVFLTPIVLILPRVLGLNGVWLAFPGADILTVGLVIALVLPFLKNFRRQAKEQQAAEAGVSGMESVTVPTGE